MAAHCWPSKTPILPPFDSNFRCGTILPVTPLVPPLSSNHSCPSSPKRGTRRLVTTVSTTPHRLLFHRDCHQHRNKACIAVGSSAQQPTSLRTYSGNRRLNSIATPIRPVIEVLLVPISSSQVVPRRKKVRPANLLTPHDSLPSRPNTFTIHSSTFRHDVRSIKQLTH